MTTQAERETVITELFAELKRAQGLHSRWPEPGFVTLTVIGEEFGEVQHAAMDYYLAPRNSREQCKRRIREELIQAGAMVLRTLFSFDEIDWTTQARERKREEE